MIHWSQVCYLDMTTETISRSELCIVAHCFYLWQDTQRWKFSPPSSFLAQKSDSQNLNNHSFFPYKKPWCDNSFWHSNKKTSSPCKYINTCLFFLISHIQVTLSNARSSADSNNKRKQQEEDLCFFRWPFIFSYHRCHKCLLVLWTVKDIIANKAASSLPPMCCSVFISSKKIPFNHSYLAIGNFTGKLLQEWLLWTLNTDFSLYSGNVVILCLPPENGGTLNFILLPEVVLEMP